MVQLDSEIPADALIAVAEILAYIYRANGYSLYSRRSKMPLVRLRLTGEGDEVLVLYPSHRGGWEAPGDFGAIAVPLDRALETISANPFFLDLRQDFG